MRRLCRLCRFMMVLFDGMVVVAGWLVVCCVFCFLLLLLSSTLSVSLFLDLSLSSSVVCTNAVMKKRSLRILMPPEKKETILHAHDLDGGICETDWRHARRGVFCSGYFFPRQGLVCKRRSWRGGEEGLGEGIPRVNWAGGR